MSRPVVDGGAVAVVVVRGGRLPVGSDEAVAEAGGAALLVGDGTARACAALTSAERVWLAEDARTAPGALAAALAPLLADVPVVVLPASPDGRDLAPRLALALDRPLLARAVTVTPGGADVLCREDQALVELAVDGPFVATLVPGVRGALPATPARGPVALVLPGAVAPVADARVREVLEPEPGTADLAEAPRVFGAGAGLGSQASTTRLAAVGASLGASVGGTRVVTDVGWLDHERQIGTTGVVIDPELYVAFGVSGAAQHTGGLGRPRHVVSVNTDPSCPMTELADLGIVADVPAVVEELARRLGVTHD
ncbi:mycofactocin-associated electron transfer flavoprotein alpha subunit [Streptomyces sp. NPDC059389]|uniref:mycofactocin-associated electron transfer flavoprotein alpha subunit n=1 Tax=Streptomyces sp. NPDC059389 TaxID=3346818 RepID=UPI0036C0D655